MLVILLAGFFNCPFNVYAHTAGVANSRLQLRQSPLNIFRLTENLFKSWTKGLFRATCEQQCEDANQIYQRLEVGKEQIQRIKRIKKGQVTPQQIHQQAKILQTKFKLTRDLIILPYSAAQSTTILNPTFNAQHSDKCSFPSSMGRYIMKHQIEAPWLFRLHKIVPGVAASAVVNNHGSVADTTSATTTATPDSDSENDNDDFVRNGNSNCGTTKSVKDVYVSVHDFNSLENYMFVPQWVLQSLDVTPGEVVRVEWQSGMKTAKQVTLRPSTAWRHAVTASSAKPAAVGVVNRLSREDKNSEENGSGDTITSNRDSNVDANVIGQLESGLSQYSALTAGATISVLINDQPCDILVQGVSSSTANAGGGIRGLKAGAVQESADLSVSLDTSLQP